MDNKSGRNGNKVFDSTASKASARWLTNDMPQRTAISGGNIMLRNILVVSGPVPQITLTIHLTIHQYF